MRIFNNEHSKKKGKSLSFILELNNTIKEQLAYVCITGSV